MRDRLMCSSCGIISSIHSAEHAYRNLTSVCPIHDFPYNKLNKGSLLQAAATIRERLMCRHAVAKVRLLFRGGFLYKTLRYSQLQVDLCYKLTPRFRVVKGRLMPALH